MVMIGLGGARALAAEEHPRGWARVQGWAADVDADDGDERRGGGSLTSRIDLTEHVRLDLELARTLRGPGEDEDAGYAQVGWRALRVGGGRVGDDWAAHVGAAPRFGVDLVRCLRLEGGLDVALGAGWLADRDGERPGPEDARAVWDDASGGGVDLYALSTAADLTLRLRPHRAVELAVGAYVDGFLAAGRPGVTDPLPEALERLARDTDLGVSATLSQGSVGAHAAASLRLLTHVCSHGTRTELRARYREAWDWIHLDPVYTALAERRPFDDVRLARVPWRTTRALELELGRAFAGGERLSVSVDVRHVSGSTTVQDFADRDGWSVGARVGGRYGPLFGAAGVRWHLVASELEPLLGPMPRARFTAQVGVLLVRRRDADVALEAGFEHGLADDWGVPRAGWAGWGGLTVAFGGARDDLASDLVDRALRLPPLPRLGPPATGRVAVRDVGSTTPSEAPATPDEALDEAHELGDLLGLGPDDVPDSLDELSSDEEVAERVDATLPGLGDLLGRVVSDDGRLSGDALLREPGVRLFSGYGVEGAGVGLSWDERLTLSRRYDLDRAAPAEAEAEAAAGESEQLLGDDLTLRTGSAFDLARANRWQKLTLAERDGDRHRVVFQGATRWTRAMRRLLSGR